MPQWIERREWEKVGDLYDDEPTERRILSYHESESRWIRLTHSEQYRVTTTHRWGWLIEVYHEGFKFETRGWPDISELECKALAVKMERILTREFKTATGHKTRWWIMEEA